MPSTGLRFSLISTDEDWIKETSDALEKSFHTKLTFYHIEGPETPEDICWQLLYLPYSDFILFDSNNLTVAQSMFGSASVDRSNVWWHVTEDTDDALQTLLTAIDARTYDEVDTFLDAVKDRNNG
jgi:hypothetical protein